MKRFINYGSNKVRFINAVPVNRDICWQVVLDKALTVFEVIALLQEKGNKQ